MFGEAFFTMMPCRCTSGGNSGCAIATRFCTCTWAMSRFVPSLNVTVSTIVPSFLHWLDMYIMPSTPLICCSIGVAIDSATVSGVRAGIDHGDGHGRRGNLRKLRDRQRESGDRADDDRDDRDHGGKDRPLDEEGGELHSRPRRACRGMPSGIAHGIDRTDSLRVRCRSSEASRSATLVPGIGKCRRRPP